jgi:phage tail sheath protein FI
VLLAPPPGLGLVEALRWRQAIAPAPPGTSDPNPNYQAAAFYWPWLLVQTIPGAPVATQSPLGFVAGVFARRDLALGPFAAPANESLEGVVGVELAIDDDLNGQAYDAGVNVIRTFPGFGQQLWGARTLACTDRDSLADRPLAFVNIRRGLSAIERSVERLGQPAVFEPNLPLLRAQLTQVVASYLETVFRSGALQGDTQDQAFYVVCNASNNPSEAVRNGQLLCEVGVAIAAPAEFIVFRVGRSEGVVEIQEVA